jgi:hypothetical protein
MLDISHFLLSKHSFPNAIIATKLRQRIIEWPKCFIPVGGNVKDLTGVKQKDTEIVFVEKAGTDVSYRIEAEIDHTHDEGFDHYNVGSIKFFYDNRRNRMMSITTIDLEK